MPELKPLPCPYCRTEEIEMWDGPANFMECQYCHMTGPHAPSESSAIGLWNSLPRAPEWQEQPKVNDWNRWTDGTCNNVIFIHQDGTGVVSGCVMHWKEIGDRWFSIPTPEDVT